MITAPTVVPESHNKESAQLSPPSEGFRTYPDEDKIESVLDVLHSFAWEQRPLSRAEISELLKQLAWVQSIWNKSMGSTRLADLQVPYVRTLSASNDPKEISDTFRVLDLIICFFHHYIYAFDDFVNRKFRNSVIRCGLICERIVKRLAIASGNQDILALPTFEQQVNKLRAVLEPRHSDIGFLTSFVRYIYFQRSRKGARDTGAAGAITAKTCLSQTPVIYLMYLECLQAVGYTIDQRDQLLELVNSTISTGTSLVFAQEGKAVRCADLLESLYKQGFLGPRRTAADIAVRLKELGFVFPPQTLHDALKRTSGKGGFLIKTRRYYVQRLPPADYYQAEVFS